MRDQEDESGAGEHRRQAYAQKKPVQAVQEQGCLVVGFQHAQTDLYAAAGSKRNRRSQKAFVAELHVLGDQRAIRLQPLLQFRQLSFFVGRQGADDDRVSIAEGHLT